jgi:hypothetical protein
VKTGSGKTIIREVDGGNAYAGQSSRRVHVGLGPDTAIASLEIRWPSGLRQKADAAVATSTIREAQTFSGRSRTNGYFRGQRRVIARAVIRAKTRSD